MRLIYIRLFNFSRMKSDSSWLLVLKYNYFGIRNTCRSSTPLFNRIHMLCVVFILFYLSPHLISTTAHYTILGEIGVKVRVMGLTLPTTGTHMAVVCHSGLGKI
jgi:hypothetical protein